MTVLCSCAHAPHEIPDHVRAVLRLSLTLHLYLIRHSPSLLLLSTHLQAMQLFRVYSSKKSNCWIPPPLSILRPNTPPHYNDSTSSRLPLTSALRLPSISRSHIPNLLTYARIATIPLLLLSELHPNLTLTPLSPLLFSLASLTDLLDGYLARRWNAQSPLGAFLDPVADKLLVAIALTLTVARLSIPAVALPAALILAREIFVSALREWTALRGVTAASKVSIWGKLKTSVQMVALGLLLLARNARSPFMSLGVLALTLAAALALFSAGEYALAATRALRREA